MTREEKSQVIEVLTAELADNANIYLADISGLNADTTSNLRRACFKANIKLADADIFGNRMRAADRLAKKYLSHAKKALGKKEAFYVALEKALHNYLKAKLREASSLTRVASGGIGRPHLRQGSPQ